VQLLDLARRTSRVLAEGDTPFHVVDRSADGGFIVAGSPAGQIAAWRKSGDEYEELWTRHVEERPSVNRVRVTPDGRYAAVIISPDSSASKEVHLIEMTSGKTVAREPVPGSFGLAFSPDGRLLAVSRESVVLVLGVPDFEILQRLEGHRQSVPAIRFSPDGRWLATGAGDRKVIVWNTQTWRARPPWVAHGGELRCLSFTPDGRTLLTASRDSIPRLWNLETGRLLINLPKLGDDAWPLLFTGDGHRIVGVHPERGLYLFDGRPVNQEPAKRRVEPSARLVESPPG
jgi:WD40 repeat protein